MGNEKFIYLCKCIPQKNARHIGKTKRYARLADGNVRNFYDMQEQCDGSRVQRGLVTASTYQGNSHNLHQKKWYISTTLLYFLMLLRCWRVINELILMDMDFFNKLNDIHSFVVLQEIFESWIKEEVINEKSMELILGYTSLINYPSIYLTKDGAEKEIAAANVCHEILMKFAKDKIKEDLSRYSSYGFTARKVYTGCMW